MHVTQTPLKIRPIPIRLHLRRGEVLTCRPAGKIRANSATQINSYSGRVVQVGIDSGFRSVE